MGLNLFGSSSSQDKGSCSFFSRNSLDNEKIKIISPGPISEKDKKNIIEKWEAAGLMTQSLPNPNPNLIMKEEIEKQLLKRFGFTKDGAIDAEAQLKIFSFIEWIEEQELI